MCVLTGNSNSNSYQYTGRENDRTGFYYYRVRYYHPELQRFLTEDDIGVLIPGDNSYTYVKNSPLNVVDPLGLWGFAVGPTIGVFAGKGGQGGAGFYCGSGGCGTYYTYGTGFGVYGGGGGNAQFYKGNDPSGKTNNVTIAWELGVTIPYDNNLNPGIPPVGFKGLGYGFSVTRDTTVSQCWFFCGSKSKSTQ